MEKNTRLIYLILPALLCMSLLAFPVFAADDTDMVTVNELIENSDEYNEKSITITGEAIGECMERGNYAWVNISDGSNAIGIWLTEEQAGEITYYGDYRHTGDTLLISGVYFKACPEHGGEPDIHCSDLTVGRVGEIRDEKIPAAKIFSAVGFVSLGLVLFISYRKYSGKNTMSPKKVKVYHP